MLPAELQAGLTDMWFAAPQHSIWFADFAELLRHPVVLLPQSPRPCILLTTTWIISPSSDKIQLEIATWGRVKQGIKGLGGSHGLSISPAWCTSCVTSCSAPCPASCPHASINTSPALRRGTQFVAGDVLGTLCDQCWRMQKSCIYTGMLT